MVAVRAVRAVHDTVGLAVGVAIGLTGRHRAHVEVCVTLMVCSLAREKSIASR